MKRNPVVYVLVEGGVIQNIWSDQPENLFVIVVDQDDPSEDEAIIHDPYPVDFASEETMQSWLNEWRGLDHATLGQ